MRTALTVALMVIALFESGFELTASRRAPQKSDWDAAAAEVRAGFRPGDLIVTAPTWADPIGRSAIGDLVSVEMAGHADTDRYARIWELSIRGAHAPETTGSSIERVISTNEHGRVTVTLYQKKAANVLYDFTSHAADARIVQGEHPCHPSGPATPGRFNCAGVTIEPRTLEIDYLPRRGILAPVDGQKTTSIEFADVTLGSSLAGHMGLHDYYSRKNADGPVDFIVFIDGKSTLTTRYLQKENWRSFNIATAPGLHTVRFDIASPAPAWRTFGFHAESRQ